MCVLSIRYSYTSRRVVDVQRSCLLLAAYLKGTFQCIAFPFGKCTLALLNAIQVYRSWSLLNLIFPALRGVNLV